MGAIKYMINLDNRLQTIYDMVRNNSKIIDVGADHGYLISKLIIDKKCPIGKCIDISLKCLKKAEKLAKYYNLEDKIKFSLSDGLSDVDENEVDDIVISGMGSELIIKIINDCKWLKKISNKYLILQPMIKPWLLREYLYNNGFKIINEKAVISNGKFYIIIKALFCGEYKKYKNIDIFIGSLLNQPDDDNIKYLKFLSKKFNKISDKILSGSKNLKRYNYYKEISEQINNLIKN